jgi:predicted aldo/keto reductase-like oxidoreductase
VKDLPWNTPAFPGTSLDVSRVALGTWAIDGWMWSGTDEAESIATIRAAVEHGINLIDTAPACGFGRSEEIVGKALAEGNLRTACPSLPPLPRSAPADPEQPSSMRSASRGLMAA